MCVKLPPRDLNIDPYSPHSTNTYTCGVTIVPRMCGGRCAVVVSTLIKLTFLNHSIMVKILSKPQCFRYVSLKLKLLKCLI